MLVCGQHRSSCAREAESHDADFRGESEPRQHSAPGVGYDPAISFDVEGRRESSPVSRDGDSSARVESGLTFRVGCGRALRSRTCGEQLRLQALAVVQSREA